jgi:GntR family transcriptional regulator
MGGRPRPRYKQVADELVAMIRSGKVAVGALLPTEIELCAQFNVSRHTTREALRLLAQMGLVDRRRGSGTRVLARRSPVKYQQFVQNIDDLLRYGDATRLEPYSSGEETADPLLAARLGVPVGSTVVHIRCLRQHRAPGLPLSHSEIWVPKPRGRRGERLVELEEAIFALLEIVNVHSLTRVEQMLEAENVDAELAARLRVEPGSAALRIERRFFGAQGELLALAVSTHPKDRYTYATVLTRASD